MTAVTPKKRDKVVGDIVEIDLGDGFHTYARAIKDAVFTVYDARSQSKLSLFEIRDSPVLFQVGVMDNAIKSGRWKIVGNLSAAEATVEPPPAFIQDPINADVFSIYENGEIRSATREECTGIERASVWDPEHVEDRIRDYYAGRPNKWVIAEKLKL